MTDRTPNPYCDRLDIAVPVLADYVAGRFESPIGMRPARPLQLLVLALLEHGAPLSLAEAAARLEAAGFRARSGNTLLTLKRAWAGRPPVVHGSGEAVDLDLHSAELDLILFGVGLRPAHATLQVVPDFEEPEPEPSDDEPLSWDDLEAALGQATHPAWAPALRVTALLDALGREALPLDDADARLARLDAAHRPVSLATASRWRAVAVRLDEDGVVHLDRNHPGVRQARHRLRHQVHQARLAREDAREMARWERQMEVRRQRARADWDRLRRCVVRVAPEPGDFVAGALVSFPPGGGRETLTVFQPGQPRGLEPREALAEALSRHDAVAGLDPRATLRALGLDPHDFRVIDLASHPRTVRVEGRRDPVRFDLQRFVKASFGLRLGEGRKLLDVLASGDEAAIRDQLTRDAWALTSLYRNGALHGQLCVTSGMRDLFLPVSWALPGEPDVVELTDQAGNEGREVEIRFLAARDALDPWRHCMRGFVHAMGPAGLELGTTEGVRDVPWRIVRDLRFTGLRDE